MRKRPGRRPTDPNKRFDDGYTMEPNSGCWLWMGTYHVDPSGYIHALLYAGGKVIRATKLAYERFVGPIADGGLICHHCDVSLCVNPAHLYLGTNQTNKDDAVRRGRTALGIRHGMSKLTVEQVIAIRADTRLFVDIGREYGVSPENVSGIKRRRTWRHVRAA